MYSSITTLIFARIFFFSSGTAEKSAYLISDSFFATTAASPSALARTFSISSDKSKDSTFIPCLCIVTSSKRTVLNAVVRAPMQPRLNRRIPFTTRHTAAKSRRFSSNSGDSGWTTWGFITVKGILYCEKTSVTENFPQNASRLWAKSILPISSGYACISMGTPAS